MEVSGTPTYNEEYKKGVDLFEKGFDAYQKSTFDAQKEEYSKSMHEALKAVRDAAGGMVKSKLQELSEKTEKDLDKFEENPSDENKKVVMQDISSLRNVE
ncbi:MAG: hypothetical protein MRY21_08105 [Simkaniaceae bacterium]|nr:hypothetical protein [Simkaniaceae bacterium]